MFKCQLLEKVSEPGEKLTKLVIKTREKTYTKRVLNEETRREEEVVCAVGSEIVKEINVCEEGAALWSKLSDLEKKEYAKKFFK